MPPNNRPTINSMITIRLVIAYFSIRVLAITRTGSILHFYGHRVGLRRVVPPSAPERLEQRRRVGIARSLGLNQIDAYLLVLTLGVEQGEITYRPELKLFSGQIERVAREGLGFGLRLE